eukprot:TRINITY_DN106645_c0_g1_i1.p1 TRINITY_DN106645_c0_g1~~TRINITY_DN106645_c0_g1_i1.p1  ORF type:complete len:356 (-),score=65.40 TRINITY_DN106645_c0_g1_i1:42-1109(-)
MDRKCAFRISNDHRANRCSVLIGACTLCAFLVVTSRRTPEGFTGGAACRGARWPGVPGPSSRSLSSRNFFEQGKIVKGSPPLPENIEIPPMLEVEWSMEGNTKYPREEEGYSGLLDIVTYPDPALRRKSVEVTEFDDNLVDFIKGLVRRMKQGGLALAAPQVGVNLRIIVMNVDNLKNFVIDPFDPDKKWGDLIFVNPKIVGYSTDFEEDIENSFSVTDVEGLVERSKTIFVSAKDMEGNPIKWKMDKPFMARVFQNAYDHLEGVLINDRLKPEAMEEFRERLDDRVQKYIKNNFALYESLGLLPDASPADVKKSYKKAMLMYHPDRNPSDEDLEKFKVIQEAYQELAPKLGIRA